MTQPHMDDNDRARFADGLMPEEERGATVAHLAGSPEEAELLADVAYILADLDPEGGVIAAAPATAGEGHVNDEDTGTDPKVVPLRPPTAETRAPRLEAAGAAGVGDDLVVQPPLSGRASPGTDAPVVPLRPPSTARTWRRAPARWVALAAVLAGVLLVPLALSRSGSRDPGDFASLLTDPRAGLPPDWDKRPWSVTRGGGDATVDNTRAARLGALQVDLEVAAAAGQAAAIRQLSDEIVVRLNDMAGSGPLAAAYRDISTRADQPAETLAAPVAEARETLVLFVDDDHFNLGAWAEAAGIAAQRRDADFFHARASRKLLDRAASLPSLNAESRTTVAAIRTAAQADEPDWTALTKQTHALLGQIGG